MVFAIVCVTMSAGAFADQQRRPEFNKKTSVSTDDHGVRTISAANAHDLYWLTGYVQAGDRLFQMDNNRRQPSGTLAELYGPSLLASDVQARTIGLRRGAEASLPALSKQTRKALDAYAAGVNAWVAENPLPPEYELLGLTEFEPWTPLDSVVVGKALAFRLSFSLDTGRTEDLTAYLTALGPQGLVLFNEDVFRSQPFDCASTVPDATGQFPFIPLPGGDTRCTGAGSAPVSATRSARSGGEASARQQTAAPVNAGGMDVSKLGRLAQQAEQALRRSPFIAQALSDYGETGSNEWGVTGALGSNGVPITANDPHLSLDTPATFYPIRQILPNRQVVGSNVPGTPFIIQGANRRIAWGSTTNPLDVTDTFLELVSFDPATGQPAATTFQGNPEPIVIVPEVFRFNAGGFLVVAPPGGGIPPATYIVPRRNNGPIIQFFFDQADPATGLVPALSVQYTGYSATRELDTFRLWNEARGFDQFVKAFEFFDVGSQNWVVTDWKGNLGYFTSAELPLRADLQAGTVAPGTVPGFFPPGVPIPPWFIRDGTSGLHEWLPVQNRQRNQAVEYEVLPFDEMPQLVNPESGWFVNANNDPAGTVLDNNPLNQLRLGGDGIYYLNAGYAGGFRAGRITRRLNAVLTANGEASMDDFEDIQADVGLLDAEYFTPIIVAAMANATGTPTAPELAALGNDSELQEAVARIADWDQTTPTGIKEGYDAGDDPDNLPEPDADEIANSVAATIYSVWRGQALRGIIDRTLGDLGLPNPGSREAMTAMRNLFDNYPTRGGFGASGINFFEVPGVPDPAERRDIIVLTALRNALDLLAGPNFAPVFGNSTNQEDYRWGLLHRITFDHPFVSLFSIPPALGDFLPPLGPAIPGIPTDGGFSVVDASSHSARADDWTDFQFGSGPNRRTVTEYASRRDPSIRSIWPGGTSGVPFPGNPLYFNFLKDWLVNDTIELTLPAPGNSGGQKGGKKN
jgi:penicillin amidase